VSGSWEHTNLGNMILGLTAIAGPGRPVAAVVARLFEKCPAMSWPIYGTNWLFQSARPHLVWLQCAKAIALWAYCSLVATVELSSDMARFMPYSRGASANG
jgi:hypothetical protein